MKMLTCDTDCVMGRPFLSCKNHSTCGSCGWNTDVEKQRINRLRAGLPALPKKEMTHDETDTV